MCTPTDLGSKTVYIKTMNLNNKYFHCEDKLNKKMK